MLATLTEAIHLVSSDSGAGHVKHIGVPRKHVRILDERLTIGPCDVDPERHVALRRAWDAEALSETFGFDDLRAAVAGDLPVVVWATRAYADRLALVDSGRVGTARPACPASDPRTTEAR